MTTGAPRRATARDVEAIAALVHAAYAPWVPILGRSPRPMVTDYAVAVEHHRIDLLHDGERLAALVEMAPAADHLTVVNVAVAPDAQHRGLGRTLLAHAEAVTRALALDEVRLYTNALMTRNVALYERLGYRLTHEERSDAFGLVLHLRKRL